MTVLMVIKMDIVVILKERLCKWERRKSKTTNIHFLFLIKLILKKYETNF